MDPNLNLEDGDAERLEDADAGRRILLDTVKEKPPDTDMPDRDIQKLAEEDEFTVKEKPPDTDMPDRDMQ
ncbi:MAG: hypothetical protein GY861_11500, partial [bacterium]|nr:hypothetical protein [bacterium]